MNLNKVIDDKYPDTHMEFRNPENDLQIDVRWDGCTHISMFSNGDTVDKHEQHNRDYLHVCNLKLFIAQLQQVLDEAQKAKFEMD